MRDQRKTPAAIAGDICQRPDKDVSGLQCGHPLPCPYHTATIDTTTTPPEIRVPITSEPAHNPKLLKTLKEIGLTSAGKTRC